MVVYIAYVTHFYPDDDCVGSSSSATIDDGKAVASLTSVGVIHRLCLFEASAPVVAVERDLNVCDVVMLCSCWIKAACAS